MLNKIVTILNKTNNLDKNEIPDLYISDGYSSEKMLYILQELPKVFEKEENICYLEIGVFRGLTLLNVAVNNKDIPCYGIDNFSFLNEDGTNYQSVIDKKKELGLNNLHLIDMDYEDSLKDLKPKIKNAKIGVFFIDGPHDYRSQLMCLAMAKPYLHEQAIIIVDDSNYQHVRQANRDFLIIDPEFKLIFEAYTHAHPFNMNETEKLSAREGWWDGINIIVKDSENKLEPMYPPTQRNRMLFLNDHLVQSMSLAEFAPLALSILNYLAAFKFLRTISLIFKNFKKIIKRKNFYKYKDANTFSETLTEFNLNKSYTGRT